MTKQAYWLLNRPRILKAQIKRKREELERLRASMLPGAIRYDKPDVQVSLIDQMPDYAAEVEELLDEIQKLHVAYWQRRDALYKFLDTLDGTVGNVMTLRYESEETFRQIAGDIGVSESTVYRAHREGCKLAENFLQQNVTDNPQKRS